MYVISFLVLVSAFIIWYTSRVCCSRKLQQIGTGPKLIPEPKLGQLAKGIPGQLAQMVVLGPNGPMRPNGTAPQLVPWGPNTNRGQMGQWDPDPNSGNLSVVASSGKICLP